jgi:hypothetical protein
MRDNKVVIGLTGVVHPKCWAGPNGMTWDEHFNIGRLNHHYPIAFGDLTNELNEFAALKELTVLDPIAYKPYLQQPTAG